MKHPACLHRLKKFHIRNIKSFLITSYTIVMFLPLIINLIVYLNAYQTIKRQAVEAQEAALLHLSSNMDNEFLQIDDFVTKISYDVNINKLFTASGMESYEQSYLTASSIYDLNETLRLNLPSNFIQDYYIFSPENNLIFHNSGINELDQYMLRNDNNSRALFTICRELDMKKMQIFCLQTDLNSSYTVLVYPLPYTYIAKGYITILLDNATLNERMASFCSQDDSQIYLVDQNFLTLNASTSLSNPGIFSNYDFSSGSIEGKLDENGEQLLMYSSPSKILPLSYICTLPESVATSSLRYMRQTLFISMLFCLIGEGVLISVLTHYNYQPWKNLLLTVGTLSISPNEYSDKRNNEYQIVSNALTSMYRQKSNIEKTLKSQNLTLASYYLTLILKRLKNPAQIDPSILLDLKNRLHLESYVVLLLFLDTGTTLKSSGVDATEQKASAIRILCEILEPFGTPTFLELGHYCTILLGMGNTCPTDGYHSLCTAVSKSFFQFSNSDKTLYFLSLSSIHYTLSDMASTYEEAAMVNSICVMHNTSIFLSYEDVKAELENPTHIYTLKEEQTLTNDIRLGKKEEAFHQIHFLMEEIKVAFPSFDTAKLSVTNILSSVSKVFSELPSSNQEEIYTTYSSLLETFMHAVSYRQLEKSLMDLTELVCIQFPVVSSPISSSNLWVEKVDQEIEAHLCDDNLNVSFIANTLGCSAKYLSSLYQKATNRTIVDTIHRKRIMKFKELLQNENTSIAEAAFAVGYTSIATLNRWVKKYEGVTPGQLKNLNKRT